MPTQEQDVTTQSEQVSSAAVPTTAQLVLSYRLQLLLNQLHRSYYIGYAPTYASACIAQRSKSNKGKEKATIKE